MDQKIEFRKQLDERVSEWRYDAQASVAVQSAASCVMQSLRSE